MNLLLGNSENTTPSAGTNTDISKYYRVAEDEDMDEFEKNRYFTKEAIAYAISHPGRTLTMYFGKLLNHFNFRNELKTESASSTRDLIMLLSYGPLLLLFLVRLALFRKYPLNKHEVLLAVLYVIGGMMYAVFFTRRDTR